MTCSGCGNKKAVKTIYAYGKGETCEKCGGHSVVLGKEKTTGFAYHGKLLRSNKHFKLARQVRNEYRGDDVDTLRGKDT